MKKVWKCCSALMLTAMILMTMVGCLGGTAREFEVGDFKFYQGEEGADLYITDLTEEGKQKRVLIVPEELDGIPIKGLEDPTVLWGGAHWQSEKVEKIYLPWNMNYDFQGIFDGCINLKGVYIISYNFNLNNINLKDRKTYYNRYIYDSLLKKYLTLDYLRPANVAYYYNDGRTENYGCYWIDNVPYGSVLDVLPPEDPVSEGKTFAGWYKEPECINAWDFETDTTPEEKLDEDGNVIYQETALYAKWV